MAKKTIWKFAIPDSTVVTLTMPQDATPLSVQMQCGSPVLWALVDPEAPKVERTFHVVGTGWDFDPTGTSYVGTFQVQEGLLVFHLFEQVTPKRLEGIPPA